MMYLFMNTEDCTNECAVKITKLLKGLGYKNPKVIFDDYSVRFLISHEEWDIDHPKLADLARKTGTEVMYIPIPTQ